MEAITSHGSTGVLWTGDEIGQLTPYFSNREASMLRHLLIVPLSDSAGPQALLVVSESPLLNDNPHVLRIILAAVAESAAGIMRSQRMDRVSVMRHSMAFKRDELDVVTARVEERDPAAVTGILLDLSDVVTHVRTANEHVDTFRVWQDILRTVAALYATTAIVTDAGSNRALVLAHADMGSDVELAVHHVAATLADYFPEIGGVSAPRYQTLRYPQDTDSVSHLASKLVRNQ